MNKFKQLTKLAYTAAREHGHRASQAVLIARFDARYNERSRKLDIMPDRRTAYEGEQITRLPGGLYTLSVRVQHDSDSGPPQEQADGHGVVSGWELHRRDEDHWQEWILSDERHSYLYYEFRETLPRAIEEGWDTAPYAQPGDARAKAYRAMRADYEFLRRYYSQAWWYVGLIVTLYEGQNDDDTTDGLPEISSESCWGFDSDSVPYLCEQAREWAAIMIHTDRETLRAARLAEQKETAERDYWHARDVLTVAGARA